MAIIAIATGIFVFLLTGAVTNEITHDPGAGVLPGLILGFLAASPLFKLAAQERANFLHPAPREYNIPAVVSAEGATRLPDRTLVTVNGHTGEVLIHSAS